MRSLNEQRSAGEGRDLGWAQAGCRLSTGRWRGSIGSGEKAPDRPPQPFAAGKFVRVGTALGGVGESPRPVFVLGDQSHQDWLDSGPSSALGRALTSGLLCSPLALDEAK